MRRIIIATAILALLTTTESLAQGRLFRSGESGGFGVFDFHLYEEATHWDRDGSLWGAVTFKGILDLGLGSGMSPDTDLGLFLFGNLVILDHNEDRDFGLQLGSLYARKSWDVTYARPPFFKFENTYLESNLRVFRRLKVSPRTRVVVGLAGIFKFVQTQSLASDGEVLYGTDRNGWGAALDLETMHFGWLLLRARLEYADNVMYPYDWRFVATLSAGLSISFGGAREATDAQ